jgi:hypothetical protein
MDKTMIIWRPDPESGVWIEQVGSALQITRRKNSTENHVLRHYLKKCYSIHPKSGSRDFLKGKGSTIKFGFHLGGVPL